MKQRPPRLHDAAGFREIVLHPGRQDVGEDRDEEDKIERFVCIGEGVLVGLEPTRGMIYFIMYIRQLKVEIIISF